MSKRYQITLCVSQINEMSKLSGNDWLERLSDITGHPPEWLDANIGPEGFKPVQTSREASGVLSPIEVDHG